MHTSNWWKTRCLVLTIACATGVSGTAHGQSKRTETKPDQVQSSLDPTEVFRKASGHVATVTTNNDRLGSAVVWVRYKSRDGAVFATNAHVVDGATSVQVQYNGKNYRASGEIVRFSRIDLAFLFVDGELGDFTAPDIRLRPLVVGERVYAVGSPKGLTMSLSDGLVSGLRVVRGAMSIQTTAPISPGSSGGGLFDKNGELVGITTAKVVGGENLNLAIPIEYVDRLFEVWKVTRECPLLDVTIPNNADDAFWKWYDSSTNKFQEWLGVAQAAIPISKPLLDACEAYSDHRQRRPIKSCFTPDLTAVACATYDPLMGRERSAEEVENDLGSRLFRNLIAASARVSEVYRRSDWFTAAPKSRQ